MSKSVKEISIKWAYRWFNTVLTDVEQKEFFNDCKNNNYVMRKVLERMNNMHRNVN